MDKTSQKQVLDWDFSTRLACTPVQPLYLGTVCHEVLDILGIKPTCVAGQRAGETLLVAGVLSGSDAIFLDGNRGKIPKQRCERNSHIRCWQ